MKRSLTDFLVSKTTILTELTHELFSVQQIILDVISALNNRVKFRTISVSFCCFSVRRLSHTHHTLCGIYGGFKGTSQIYIDANIDANICDFYTKLQILTPILTPIFTTWPKVANIDANINANIHDLAQSRKY